MRHLLRILSVLAILAVLGSLSAPAASAQTACTDQYAACLNVAGQLDQPFQSMADIECGAKYVGCVARGLKFW